MKKPKAKTLKDIKDVIIAHEGEMTYESIYPLVDMRVLYSLLKKGSLAFNENQRKFKNP